ncbi:MAG: VCBS repeat-containing protein [Bacteroidia bacterium]|nr:VCBS repeat-containing protein [Bacteroidia bacterium]
MDGLGIGNFISNLKNLLPGTTYFIKAYSTNIVGTTYGPIKSIKTLVLKNYLLPSYILRKSDLWLDYAKIPQSNGIFNNFWYTQTAAIADFNGDGFDDISYAPTSTSGIAVLNPIPIEIYLNDKSNEKFILDKTIISQNIGTSGTSIRSIIGDFNGDGKPDVFYPDGGTNDIIVPNGQYASLLLSSPLGYEIKYLNGLIKPVHTRTTSGDFDNDGDLDIFVTNMGAVNCYFLINDGKGNFTVDKSIFQSKGDAILPAELIDVDKDGFLDLLIGGHTMYTNDMECNHIFWGNGKTFSDLNVSNLPNIPGWGVSLDFAVEDIDNDGINEVIVNRTGGIPSPTPPDTPLNFYVGYRLQFLKKDASNIYRDISDKVAMDYFTITGGAINKIQIQDIDKNGKLDIFDPDKNQNLRWERDTDGIFRKK